MTRLGLRVELDVNDMISNAGRAQKAISAITDAMKKAEQEKRIDDYGKLAYEKQKLQSQNAGFERDVQNLTSNPRFQTQAPNGSTIFKIDAEYAGLIKGQMAAMKQQTAKLEKATKTGNIDQVQKFISQIARQQEDFHKTLKRISGSPKAQEGTDTVKAPNGNRVPELAPQVPRQQEDFHKTIGGFISSATIAKQVILNIDKAIEKAKKADDDSKVGQLYVTKQQVNTAHEKIEHDTRSLTSSGQPLQRIMGKQVTGQVLSKREEAYISHLDLLNDTLKKNTSVLLEASKTGDAEEMLKQTPHVMTQVEGLHQVAQQGTSATDKGSMKDVVKTIGVNQMVNAVTDGLSRWVGSLDRSGIVSKRGSGDVIGANIDELRRQANLKSGIGQSAGGIAGGIAGALIGSIIPGLGTVAGSAIGGSLGSGAGKLFGLSDEAKANKQATDKAHSDLWQNRSGQTMELAALQGSPSRVREAFSIAADAAARFGYSAEEGVDAMKQAAQQGLSGAAVREVTERVFTYERSTGADRGALMGISTMAKRYGAGDALGTGWQGLQASGMKTGQYNEYLRAMQRVMEDGISKGFVRSSEQVARNLTMLSQMTGNNPLWQGENGARRLSEMNAGLENARGLQSTSDVIAFRAARTIAERNNSAKSVSYIEAQKVLEGGLTPELFREYMSLTSQAEGGDRAATVERMRQTFGLNYTNADTLYGSWEKNKNMSENELKALIDQYKNEPPPANSAELEASKTIEEIKNLMTKTGQEYWDRQLGELKTALENAKQKYNEATGSNVPIPALPITDVSRMRPEEAVSVRNQEMVEAMPWYE